jgi:hypothetical protein
MDEEACKRDIVPNPAFGDGSFGAAEDLLEGWRVQVKEMRAGVLHLDDTLIQAQFVFARVCVCVTV